MNMGNMREISVEECMRVSGGFGYRDIYNPLDMPQFQMPNYIRGVDYCGSGWTNGIVPDSLFGVDISYACFVHDQNYSENSTMDRIDADLQFARDIFRILTDSGVNEIAAAQAATIYLMGVRGPGFFAYEGQGSPL
jgi:hypothetical protein